MSNKVSKNSTHQQQLLHAEPKQLREPAGGLFSVVIPPLDGEFLYRAEKETEQPTVGMRLNLPFGRREAVGFIVSVDSEKERAAFTEMQGRGIETKSISMQGASLAFSQDQFTLFTWMAKYYNEPLSKIIDVAVPLCATGRRDPSYQLIHNVNDHPLGKLQLRVVEFLRQVGGTASSSDIRAQVGSCSPALSALIKRGIIRESAAIVADHSKRFTTSVPADILNSAQLQSGDAIAAHVSSKTFASFLLHGVTGSGKTEVYMHAIRAALSAGLGSLIIVPEIALTPQLVERFERKVGAPIAVLHSSLKPRERWHNWSRLLSGEVVIALGARSAIFAPVHNLGLIVVDEEHDGSFKQNEGIRYNARDLALVRGKMTNCPVVLGSATPSLETFYHSLQKRHTLLELPARFHDAKQLKYTLIDLNKIKPWEMPSKSISQDLQALIQKTIDREEQAFILYNRRGFASYFQCSHCEYVVKCPHCSVTLTFHQRPVSLLCHFCGFSSAPLLICPACNRSDPKDSKHTTSHSSPFVLRGGGTERISDELRSLFPKARLAQLDRDTATSISDYTEILGKVRDKSVDILVGTQMIAKGHDLPEVTFVGVVDCDVGLHMPDFRASERIFQLLTQVSGRAGRREKQGHVALQTRLPNHPSILSTIRENYVEFAHHELKERQELGNPPFQRMLRIVISAEDRNVAQNAAHHVAQVAHPLAAQYCVKILGPAAAPIEKVRRHWRFHLLGKSESAPKLQAFMTSVRQRVDLRKEIRVVYDIDPQDMM